MEDKASRSRRSGLDRCSDGIKKHSSEICYEDSFSRSRSSDSPSCHKKSHYGVHVEKDYRNDNYQQTNDRFRDQKHKDHKAEVHRLAELVCGDWSEHVSSSGKRYYYNCKTEVSQWEKPKEWNEVSVLPPSIHSDLSQQAFHDEIIADRSVKDDGMSLQSTVHVDDRLNNKSSYNSQQLKSSGYSRSQSSSNSVPTDVAKLTVDALIGHENRQKRENDSKRFTNSVKSSSFADSSGLENSHWSESQTCSLPVSVSGIYGLVSSSRESSSAKRHNGSKNVDTSQADTRLTTDEDMDISPGSTPTEESLLEKRLNAFNSTSSPNTSHLTADHADDPSLCDGPSTARNSSPSNGTFLSTLTSLQQALHHVTPSGNSSLAKSVPSSTLNLLASLPSLVNQLQEAERGSLATIMSSQSQHSNQQQILQQVIQMLQKLQQALVAQQQQQQQRQLQELLRQLLNMQKQDSVNSTAPTSSALSNQPSTQQNSSLEESLENAKLESPYSPPDSDGTPLGSPENNHYNVREGVRQVVDIIQSNESPRSNEQGTSSSIVKQPSNSPDRTVAVTTAGSNSMLIVIPSSVQSTILVGTSHLGTGVLRKQQDSIGLTPTLANYVNNRLTDHIVGWQTESVERQANCYSEESNSSASLVCTQTSVDLKQARSLVRLNEIQTTLQEQRVMFIRQQMKDLENMRTGHVFQANVHSTDT